MKLRAMAVTMLLGVGQVWAGSATDGKPVGASVAELLTLAQEMNPGVAAAVLETEAAQARVRGADALPDPRLQVTFDDISKSASGWPGRVATYKYTVQQELPWWGKREVKREIAVAEGREMTGQQEEMMAEVAMRVKVAYADYHRLHLSMDQTGELIQVLRTLVEFTKIRYGQGQGGQQEATTAEMERGAMSAELVRLQQERHRIRARLNALVNRPSDAPLVEHPRLRSMPAAKLLDYQELLERGLAANPGLRMGQARLAAAEGNVRLAKKNWYPDLEVGIGLVDRRDEGAMDGFEAMVSINLPLQWQQRQAQERDAVLKHQAAGERLKLERLRVESGLREALLNLEEAKQVEGVTRGSLLPQAQIALQAALTGYETGTAEAINVLDAVQRLKKFQIELIKAQYDQQVRLAEIERFVGGEL